MGNRSKRSQSKHDAEVQRIAKNMKDKGYQVQADVTGYPQPDSIGGHRPDVVAKKGTERKIIEVETPESKGSERDKKQQSAFRAAADRSSNTTFRRVITKDDD